ncbi:MAG TPA: ATP-dependent Clp protease proteolytic subunit [Leptospiraceae bacterium]|nr:ATP-dependent Clp protease proteolytic subunit [Spirochaetaceae bacterium]HBS05557.1 ATP-dependent Clp protease proteolytic subunit [Leptospiraceae bacterium]|tara:strand:- start:17639 stop:18289 length:651 start_codon:yes stop_codon:yes gene_type:complete
MKDQPSGLTQPGLARKTSAKGTQEKEIPEYSSASRTVATWALDSRRLYLWGPVDDNSARQIVEGLHYLSEQSNEEILFFIHSPGGATHSGMAILDSMRIVECDVRTVCLGLAASFGALLLMAGTRGKRHCLPNSKIMIHQPHVTGQYQSVATDLRIFADSVIRERDEIDAMIAEFTGQHLDSVQKDTDRDRWIYAQEAVDYGIVDSVIRSPGFSGN